MVRFRELFLSSMAGLHGVTCKQLAARLRKTNATAAAVTAAANAAVTIVSSPKAAAVAAAPPWSVHTLLELAPAGNQPPGYRVQKIRGKLR